MTSTSEHENFPMVDGFEADHPRIVFGCSTRAAVAELMIVGEAYWKMDFPYCTTCTLSHLPIEMGDYGPGG